MGKHVVQVMPRFASNVIRRRMGNGSCLVAEGRKLPKLLSILTGWGKHSKVVGDGTLKCTVEALAMSIGMPFQVAKCDIRRFMACWLIKFGMLNLSVFMMMELVINPRGLVLQLLLLLFPIYTIYSY